MSTSLVESIQSRMRQQSTEELLGIWTDNDQLQWSKETFEAIRLILTERAVTLPQQAPARTQPPPAPLHWAALRWIGTLAFTFVVQVGILFAIIAFLGRRARYGWAHFATSAALTALAVGLAYLLHRLVKMLSAWIWEARGRLPERTGLDLCGIVTLVGGVGGWLWIFIEMPDWALGLLLLSTLVAGLVWLSRRRTYCPRTYLAVQVAIAGTLTTLFYSVGSESFARFEASQRVPTFQTIARDCSQAVTMDDFRRAVQGPARAAGMPPPDRSVLVLQTTDTTMPCELVPSPVEWYLPRECLAPDVAQVRIVVILGPIGRIGPATPLDALLAGSGKYVAPIHIIRWPEKTPLARGTADLGLPARPADATEEIRTQAHRMHRMVAQGIQRLLKEASPDAATPIPPSAAALLDAQKQAAPTP